MSYTTRATYRLGVRGNHVQHVQKLLQNPPIFVG
jgi:hypothetical protein